jgi:S-methylmethionine-dependent homocysteine/selenocysteine methylase
VSATKAESNREKETTMHLPQLTADRPYLADGGLETVLIFLEGIDLPDFAAFPLVDTAAGQAVLTAYYETYLQLAARHGRGVVLDTPTWRASLDWGARRGYDRERLIDVNRRAVGLVRAAAARFPQVPAVVNGAVGPRGDGYSAGLRMSVSEASRFHGLQARAFAAAGADMMSAITMTYVEEAIGITRAAVAAGLPVAVSFTVETDGRLPSGQPLGEAVRQVDDATGGAPAYYLVNCAHPTHFDRVLDQGAGTGWVTRIKGVRANASTMSHAELDVAPGLDRGDIADLARRYRQLQSRLDLRVVGGCCGTDHEHIEAIAVATADSPIAARGAGITRTPVAIGAGPALVIAG